MRTCWRTRKNPCRMNLRTALRAPALQKDHRQWHGQKMPSQPAAPVAAPARWEAVVARSRICTSPRPRGSLILQQPNGAGGQLRHSRLRGRTCGRPWKPRPLPLYHLPRRSPRPEDGIPLDSRTRTPERRQRCRSRKSIRGDPSGLLQTSGIATCFGEVMEFVWRITEETREK